MFLIIPTTHSLWHTNPQSRQQVPPYSMLVHSRTNRNDNNTTEQQNHNTLHNTRQDKTRQHNTTQHTTTQHNAPHTQLTTKEQKNERTRRLKDTRTRSEAKHQQPATAHQQQPPPLHPNRQTHKRHGNKQEAH